MLYQLSYSRPWTSSKVDASRGCRWRQARTELVPGLPGRVDLRTRPASADGERVLLRGARVLAAGTRHFDQVIAFLERDGDQLLFAFAVDRVRGADHLHARTAQLEQAQLEVHAADGRDAHGDRRRARRDVEPELVDVALGPDPAAHRRGQRHLLRGAGVVVRLAVRRPVIGQELRGNPIRVVAVLGVADPLPVELARSRLDLDQALPGWHAHVGQHLALAHTPLVGAGEELRLVSRLRARRENRQLQVGALQRGDLHVQDHRLLGADAVPI